MSGATMRASVLVDVGRLEVREVPRSAPGPRDVLVRTTAVGLCGTDLHILSGEANYNTDERGAPIPLSVEPQILGHEIAGVVEEAGAAVNDLATGDRIVVDQGINCVSAERTPRCEFCATGHSHQCEHYLEHGIKGLPGALADFVSVPSVNAVRVQSDLPVTETALVEPLACVAHACDMLARATGARYMINAADPSRRVRAALVFGAGPAGLLFTQYLLNVLHFDGTVLVSEPNAHKRALAAALGAEPFDPTAVDAAAFVAHRTAGRRVELAIDASGAGAVFTTLPGVLRTQGTMVLYGHGHGSVGLSALNAVQFTEPTFVVPTGASGGFDDDGRPSTYRRSLRLLEEGRVRVASIVSHRYASLDDVGRALTEDYYLPDYVKGVVTLAG
jgi:L-iditol 2-dehydrogenase